MSVLDVSRRAFKCVATWVLLSLGLNSFAVYAVDVVLFAAASMKPALDEIIISPEVAAIATVKVSYAATSVLARQIEQGAPAALFISADREWMDYLEQRQWLVADTRSDLIGNQLVLIAPRDSTIQLSIADGFDLRGALGANGRLALAETSAVPAGRYAKAALTKLNVWDAISGRVVATENVRAALTLTGRGEAALGVVYRSDAQSDANVKIIDGFPEGSHMPIVYPMAIVRGQDNAAVRQVFGCLKSQSARTILLRHGFTVP